jgi:hypothetical protein
MPRGAAITQVAGVLPLQRRLESSPPGKSSAVVRRFAILGRIRAAFALAALGSFAAAVTFAR